MSNAEGRIPPGELASHMYNPQLDSWTPVAFYGNRGFGMTFTLNSKIYYACGGNGKDGLLNDFREFTLG